MINIIGLGSLLSEESARRTCPSMQNFRLVKLSGYRRVFNKTDSDFVKINQMPVAHKNYACLSAIPSGDNVGMIVSTFKISEIEWLPFLKREFEYKLVNVPFNDIDGSTSQGILCMGDYQSDIECELVCKSDPYRGPLWSAYKQNCDEPMWRTDLLPDIEYLKRCLRFAKNHGEDVYTNFVQTTYVGDQSQTIQQYLKSTDLSL